MQEEILGRYDYLRNVWEWGYWETNTRFKVLLWNFA